MLLGSERSAITNRAIRASSVIVSSVVWLIGFSKSNTIGSVCCDGTAPNPISQPVPNPGSTSQHRLGSDGVDDVANLLIIQHEVDELGDLNIIDCDLGLVRTCDNQALLLGPVQF